MALRLGEQVPDFQADSTHGTVKFHDFINSNWVVFFSHPKDFTPVCTTELGVFAKHAQDFEQRGVKLLGISNDKVDSHKLWLKDVEAFHQAPINYPVIADPERKVAPQFNMVDLDATDENGRPLTNRALHIIGPDKKLKLSLLYPGSTGRDIVEILRVLDSLQAAAKHKIATPANWKKGSPVIVPNDLGSNKEVGKMFKDLKTEQLPSGKDYLRTGKLSEE